MKPLCRLPFDHLFINNAGTIHPCCLAYPQYTLQDEYGLPTNLRNVEFAGLKAAWNSHSMQSLRKKMEKGEWPSACKVCERLESNRQPSRRMREGLLQDNATAKIDSQIRSLDIRIGNKCNLMCRMCSPFSSSNLTSEWADADPNIPPPSSVMRDAVSALRSQFPNGAKVDWQESPEFWQELSELAPFARDIHFAGGEPFLNKTHLKFLESLVLTGQSRETRLSYNTNLTVVPEWLKSLAEEFAEVRILVSIDAVGSLAEYIRYPLKWTSFLTSLEKLDALCSAFREKISVAFNTTVQVYTIAGLADFVQFLETHTFRNLPRSTTTNILHNPTYFNLSELPDPQKLEAVEFIEKMGRSVSHESSRKFLAEVVAHIRTPCRTDAEQTWKEFCSVTRRYDLQRKQDFQKLSIFSNFVVK